MLLQKLHHVAYRCKDARETAEFYTKVLGLRYSAAVTNDRVPSTQEDSPHFHLFFEMEDGSYIAFFEVPKSPEMAAHDPNTPSWVQHLALEVADVPTLLDAKKRIESFGINVLGPTDHGMCRSIYFFDPSGHRLELTARTWTRKEQEEHAETAGAMLDEWERRKRAKGWVGARAGQAAE